MSATADTATQGTAREVALTVRTIRTDEGPEILFRTLFPQGRMPYFDPFVLLQDTGGDYEGGLPNALAHRAHAHSGMIALTYIADGVAWYAKDTMGNELVQEAGSVSWLGMGRGVVHIERPLSPVREHGGYSSAFQTWVNVPNSMKNDKPTYLHVPPAEVPRWTSPDGKVEVIVVTGEFKGLSAVCESPTPLLYLHARIEPGGALECDVPHGFNAVIYPFTGASVQVEDVLVERPDYAVLGEGDYVRLSVPEPAEEATDVLVVGGKPIGEEIFRIGPFAAPTLEECFERFAEDEDNAWGVVDDPDENDA